MEKKTSDISTNRLRQLLAWANGPQPRAYPPPPSCEERAILAEKWEEFGCSGSMSLLISWLIMERYKKQPSASSCTGGGMR